MTPSYGFAAMGMYARWYMGLGGMTKMVSPWAFSVKAELFTRHAIEGMGTND